MQQFQTPEQFEDSKCYEELAAGMRELKQNVKFFSRLPLGPDVKKTIICDDIAASNQLMRIKRKAAVKLFAQLNTSRRAMTKTLHPNMVKQD